MSAFNPLDILAQLRQGQLQSNGAKAVDFRAAPASGIARGTNDEKRAFIPSSASSSAPAHTAAYNSSASAARLATRALQTNTTTPLQQHAASPAIAEINSHANRTRAQMGSPGIAFKEPVGMGSSRSPSRSPSPSPSPSPPGKGRGAGASRHRSSEDSGDSGSDSGSDQEQRGKDSRGRRKQRGEDEFNRSKASSGAADTTKGGGAGAAAPATVLLSFTAERELSAREIRAHLEAEVAGLQERLAPLRRENERLREERDKAQSALAELRDKSAATVAALRGQLSDLTRRYNDLKAHAGGPGGTKAYRNARPLSDSAGGVSGAGVSRFDMREAVSAAGPTEEEQQRIAAHLAIASTAAGTQPGVGPKSFMGATFAKLMRISQKDDPGLQLRFDKKSTVAAAAAAFASGVQGGGGVGSGPKGDVAGKSQSQGKSRLTAAATKVVQASLLAGAAKSVAAQPAAYAAAGAGAGAAEKDLRDRDRERDRDRVAPTDHAAAGSSLQNSAAAAAAAVAAIVDPHPQGLGVSFPGGGAGAGGGLSLSDLQAPDPFLPAEDYDGSRRRQASDRHGRAGSGKKKEKSRDADREREREKEKERGRDKGRGRDRSRERGAADAAPLYTADQDGGFSLTL